MKIGGFSVLRADPGKSAEVEGLLDPQSGPMLTRRSGAVDPVLRRVGGRAGSGW